MALTCREQLSAPQRMPSSGTLLPVYVSEVMNTPVWTWLVIETMTVPLEKPIGKQDLYTDGNEGERRQTDICCA